MSTARFRRHFLPWNQPWLPQVAQWLARDWKGTGPLDLSKLLVVVPTRQSGRRLRETLAEHASRRGAAVFPPRAQTPDTLLALGAEKLDVASRLEALLAWAAVLRRVDLHEVREVFPQPPTERDIKKELKAQAKEQAKLLKEQAKAAEAALKEQAKGATA